MPTPVGVTYAFLSNNTVLAGDPRQFLHRIFPSLYLLSQPCVLGLPVADESAKLATPGDHLHTYDPEEFLCPGNIPLGYDQYTLGQFR